MVGTQGRRREIVGKRQQDEAVRRGAHLAIDSATAEEDRSSEPPGTDCQESQRIRIVTPSHITMPGTW